MKKSFSIIFAIIMLFSLAVTLTACGGNGNGNAEYTITFDSKGGSAVSKITGKAGAEIKAPAAPEKDGFEFLGWFESSDSGKTLSETAFTINIMPARNVTLYAKWGVLSVKDNTYIQKELVATWGSDEEKARVFESMEVKDEEELKAKFAAMNAKIVFVDEKVSIFSDVDFSASGLYYSISDDGIMTFYETADDKENDIPYKDAGFTFYTFTVSKDCKTISMKSAVAPNSYLELIYELKPRAIA